MFYCIARAVRAGRLYVADYTPEGIEVYADEPLLGQIKMAHYTVEEEAFEDFLPRILTAALVDGSLVERVTRNPKGNITKPFLETQKREKFLDCMGGHSSAEGLYEQLQHLVALRSLGVFIPLFW